MSGLERSRLRGRSSAGGSKTSPTGGSKTSPTGGLTGGTARGGDWSDFRAHLCLCLLLVGFGLLAVQLYRIQVLDHERFRKLARRQQVTSEVIPARRGTIYDRKFRKLALTREVESCFVSPVEVEDPAAAARTLGRLLGLDASQLARKIGEQRQRGRQFLWVKRHLSDREAARLQALTLPGVHLRQECQRVYPAKALAAHVLGFTDIDGRGLEGLEGKFDKVLTGTPGRRMLYRDGRRRRRTSGMAGSVAAQDGRDLVLTLDVAIQGIVEQELDRIMRQWEPKAATVIVMDVASGEVLALGNRPTFDPNQPGRAPAEARLDRAVACTFEPGSVFKPFALAAALEAGVLTLDDEIFCHLGYYKPYRARGLRDHKPFGWLTAREVVVKSSNIGMAIIGERLGAQRLHGAASDFGFGAPTGVELPGEVRGTLYPLERWNPTSVSRVPMGHEVSVTALQLLTAFNAFANDGVLVPPRVVRAIVDSDRGMGRRTERPPGRRVLTAEVARTMLRQVLADVVREGTGRRAQLTTYEVAGKTGTAQKLVDGRYSHTRFVSSFLCVAPVERPRISVLVTVDEPAAGHSYYGGTVAAPSAARVVEEALLYLQVPPQALLARSPGGDAP